MGRTYKLCGITFALLAVMLAGCAEDGGPTEAPDQNEPGEVIATETTGGIRGVVVDNAIVPIAGATIKVLSTDDETTTDEKGNFVISGLEAGSYFIEVSAMLHESQQRNVEVIAGVSNPEAIKIQLTRTINFDPYAESFTMKGYISCSANVLLPLLGGVLSEECGEGVGYPCQLPDTVYACNERIGKNSENMAQLDFFVSNADPKTLIAEAVWEPSLTAGTGAQEGGFNMGIYVDFNCDPFCGWANQIDRADGFSPLYLRSDTDEEGDYGGDTVLAELNATPETRFSTFTWAAADGSGVLLEQEFDVYVTASYGLALPDEWSYVGNSPNPF